MDARTASSRVRTGRRESRSPWVPAGLLGLALVLYVFPLTLDIPLVDPDEGLHAAIAQEMVERGDWVTPRLFGQPFLDKPVLFFWAQALSLDLLGMRVAAVRLPGLAFGLLGCLTTALLGGALAGRRVGVTSGVFYATMLLPMSLAQAAVHDVALVPWTNLMMLFLWRACLRSGWGGALGQAVLAGVFIGLAGLTKGLVGVALIGIPFAVVLTWERRLDHRMVVVGVSALAVGIAIAAPWYAAMARIEPGYLRYFFIDRHLLGFATTTQIHGNRPWWYYLPIIAGGAWPWILYLGFATPSRVPAVARPALRLLWVWVVVGLGLLSVAGSKLVTYVLPVLPAVAILAAWAWDQWVETSSEEAPRDRGASAIVWSHSVLGLAVVVAAVVFVRVRYDLRVPVALGATMIGLVVTYAVGLRAWRSGHRRQTLTAFVAAVAVMFVGIMTSVFPAVAADLSARDLSRFLNGRGALPPQVWMVDERIGSVIFYLRPALRAGLEPGRFDRVPFGAVPARLAAAPADAMVVVAARDVSRLAPESLIRAVPFEQAGRYRVYTAGDLRTHLRGGSDR